MTDTNRIQLPGRVNIGAQFHPGMNADPVTVELKSPEGIQVFVTGGESKPERHAIALLAGMLANPSLAVIDTGDRDRMAAKAVDMAYRMQVALAARTAADAKAAENGKLEI